MVKIKKTSSQSQRGFTILELMIAITLGLFLIAAASRIMVNGIQIFSSVNSLSRVQESGAMALIMLVSDIKRAGYLGGNSDIGTITDSIATVTPTANCDNNNSWARMITQPLFGTNNSKSGYSCVPSNYLTNTDIVAMRYASSNTVKIPESNRIYLRSSLFEGKIFLGKNAASNQVADEPNDMRELVAHAYFIGESNRICDGQKIPSLYRMSLDNTGKPFAEELLPGIEDLQVQYGMSDSSDNRYLDVGDTGLNTLADWSNVTKVRISILARSECRENGFIDNRTYNYGDKRNYKPNDGYRRQLYNNVIQIRNFKG